MIRAYPARTDDPLVDLYREWEEGRISYGETLAQLTPDEARALAEDLIAAAQLCETRDHLPIHRTEAGYPNCATCDGGGCHDCTDPA